MKPIKDDDVFELTNKAYDRGGADVLKLELMVLSQIEASLRELDEIQASQLRYGVEFSRMLIEQVRLKLSETIENEPTPEPESKIVIPDGLLAHS